MKKFKLLLLLCESLLPSRLRCALMRRRGAVIGRGVKLGIFSLFQCGKVTLGNDCWIGPFTRFKVLDELEFGEEVKVGQSTRITGRRIVIGSETTVGVRVHISGSGRFAVLTCGPRCYIGDGSYFDLTRPITAGMEAGLGGASLFFTHGSWQSELDGFPVTAGAIEVGDFAWLGWNVTLLSGVKIGEFALVGAGSVVRSDVPAYSQAAGNPARVMFHPRQHMKTLTQDERFAICRAVMDEMTADLQWQGNQVECHGEGDTCRVTVNGQTVLLARSVTAVEKADAVASLERMSNEMVLALEAAGCDWFDLGRRRCSRPQSPLNGIVRAAFSQRGVRFQPTERGVIAEAPDIKGADTARP